MAFTNNNTLGGFGLTNLDLINNGVVDVVGGVREINGILSSTAINGGTVLIEATGTLLLDKAASGNNVSFKAGTGVLEILQLGSIASTFKIISIFAGDKILLPNAPTGFGMNYNVNTGTLAITNAGLTVGSLVFTPAASLTAAFFANTVLQCFAAGTRIATPEGERAIETLRPGDLVQLLNGDAAEIAWTGARPVDCARHKTPETVRPFRVAAGAFGPGLPARDLFLSPDHAIFVDEVLIPVKYLANGTTIRQVKPRAVTYHHIELHEHQVVLAEGLTVETLLPGGDKTSFASGSSVTRLSANFSARDWEALGFAPLVLVGPILDNVRARLSTTRPKRAMAA